MLRIDTFFRSLSPSPPFLLLTDVVSSAVEWCCRENAKLQFHVCVPTYAKLNRRFNISPTYGAFLEHRLPKKNKNRGNERNKKNDFLKTLQAIGLKIKRLFPRAHENVRKGMTECIRGFFFLET